MASVSSSQPSASAPEAVQREEDPLSPLAAVQREALPEEEEEPGS
jgi:hypothetical protein